MPPDQLEERAKGRLGTVLRGKYRLDRVLGVGGMAVVYKATHRNQAEFAIKMLHPELSINEDVRTRFLREGYAANSVKHAGAVRVVDDDVAEDGSAFLVMELLDGIACDSLLSACGGRLPLDAACAIAVELLDVLATAHANGIVHRDVKPANLFLCRDGTLKVLDFGIARVRDTMASGTHATGTGMLLGTPAFMSPEQALGKASEIDARADLWSVGATVFSLTSGEMVHEAETAPQLLVKLATERARSLASVVPGAPPPIVSVIDQALALDKAQRWPTAVAMRDALAWARHSSGGEAPPRTVMALLAASYAPAAMGHGTPAWVGQPQPFPATPATPATPAPPMRYPSGPGPMMTPGLAPVSASPAATPASETTTPPVSQSNHAPPGRRSAGRTVLTAGILLALGAAGGVAVALHATKKVSSPGAMTETGVSSAGVSDLQSAAPATAAAALATAPATAAPTAANGPSEPPKDGADAGAHSVAVPASTKKGEAARPNVAPPSHAMPAGHAGGVGGVSAGGTPVARPEGTTPAPVTRPAGGQTAAPVPPSTDPLDGRR
jgi:serine/threonine-protein kinase